MSELREVVTAVGIAVDDNQERLKKLRKRVTRFGAVLDRKLNILIGCWDFFGSENADVLGKSFDPLEHEDSFSKKVKHVIPFGSIQKSAGETVGDGEEG